MWSGKVEKREMENGRIPIVRRIFSNVCFANNITLLASKEPNTLEHVKRTGKIGTEYCVKV